MRAWRWSSTPAASGTWSSARWRGWGRGSPRAERYIACAMSGSCRRKPAAASTPRSSSRVRRGTSSGSADSQAATVAVSSSGLRPCWSGSSMASRNQARSSEMRRGRSVVAGGRHGSSPDRRSGTPGGRVRAIWRAPSQSGRGWTSSRMVTSPVIPSGGAPESLTTLLCKDIFAFGHGRRSRAHHTAGQPARGPRDGAHRPARDARLRAPDPAPAARPAAPARPADRDAGGGAAGGELGHDVVPPAPAREVRLLRAGGGRQGAREAVAGDVAVHELGDGARRPRAHRGRACAELGRPPALRRPDHAVARGPARRRARVAAGGRVRRRHGPDDRRGAREAARGRRGPRAPVPAARHRRRRGARQRAAGHARALRVPQPGRTAVRVPPLLRENAGFRRFWASPTVSLAGDHITLLALPLVGVLALHAGPGRMGLLTAAAWAPSLVLSLHAGAWVDRTGHVRATMIAADLGRAALLVTVPIAWALGALSFAQLVVVAFAAGALGTFATVAYGAVYASLVERERLVEAGPPLHAGPAPPPAGRPRARGGARGGGGPPRGPAPPPACVR